MSDSKEYVKSKLKELASEFPNLKYSYRFDASDKSHIVYAAPDSFQFDKRCMEVDLEFISKYPSEVLYFVERDLDIWEVVDTNF